MQLVVIIMLLMGLIKEHQKYLIDFLIMIIVIVFIVVTIIIKF